MDFDSIITVVFIIGFFVLPTILKQVQARKKKKAAASTTPTKSSSIFGRVGDQIRQFVEDLEKQARQQEKEGGKDDSMWEGLSDEASLPPLEMEDAGNDADFKRQDRVSTLQSTTPAKVASPVRKVLSSAKKSQPGKKEPAIMGPAPRSVSRTYRFKCSSLQNAVVMSEILAKPLALKNKY